MTSIVSNIANSNLFSLIPVGVLVYFLFYRFKLHRRYGKHLMPRGHAVTWIIGVAAIGIGLNYALGFVYDNLPIVIAIFVVDVAFMKRKWLVARAKGVSTKARSAVTRVSELRSGDGL